MTPSERGISHHRRLAGVELPPDFCLNCPDRRLAEESLRELASGASAEAALRADLAQDATVIHDKDVVIQHLKVLSQECDHRLLNNLQMVVSLLAMQGRTAPNPEARAELSIASNRVAAIARIHRRLHAMDGSKTISFKHYLEDLCQEYATMLGWKNHPDRSIVVEGVEVMLATDVGIPLSLVVNELLTNAVKHGTGRIAVKLATGTGTGHVLSVSNDGAHLPEGFDPTGSTGMGMKLIASLVRQIGGTLHIDGGEANEGTRFTVCFA